MASAATQRMRLCVLLLATSPVESFRGPGLWPHRTSSMRSRYALAAMSSNETGTGGGLAGLFGINRNTPEAQANQLQWAREQMDMEVPSSTLEGSDISNREVRPPTLPHVHRRARIKGSSRARCLTRASCRTHRTSS